MPSESEYLIQYRKNLALGFITSFYGPSVIFSPNSKLVWRSSLASFSWYAIIFGTWTTLFYTTKDQVLDLKSNIVKSLELEDWFVPSVGALLVVSLMFSWILQRYASPDVRKWFGLKTKLGSLTLPNETSTETKDDFNEGDVPLEEIKLTDNDS